MPDIDKLVLQIESESKSAVSGIDALATSLGKLKSATSGGLGLSSIAKGLDAINSSTNKMGNITNKLNGLARAVKELTNLGNIKVSASIGNQITKIGTALSTFNMGDGANKIQELVTALKPLETLGKSSLSTTVNALNKLPEAIQKIDMRKLHGQVGGLTRIMKPLADEMQKVANGFNAFPSKIQKLIKENDNLSSSNKKTSESYIDMAAKMQTVYAAIKKVFTIIGSFIEKSANYVENVNLFTVAMGNYAEEARGYAETVGEVMGIDPGEWMRNQGTFMTLATGFGIVGERANVMSQNLTQLGYDLSSFFNLPYEDAMQKLESGLAGELEPLRRIGFDLSVARLQQEAYTLGINKKVSAMTQAEKAELRYHAILTQVTTAQGDMARTLEQPANQIRIFKSQVEQAARSIGNMFIPMLQAVLPYGIAFMRIIRLVADELARLFGYTEDVADTSGLDSLASGADDYSNALGDAADNAKKLQQYTMGFDELNVIDPNKGKSSDTGSTGGTGFDFELPKLEEITKGFETEADKIFEKMKENLGLILGLVAGVGAGLLAWGFSKSFLTGLTAFTATLGAALLIDSVRVTFKEGLSWKSIIEGAIGGALLGAAIGFKLGGIPGAIGGIVIGIGLSLVINGITSMLGEGVNVENVVTLIAGVLSSVGAIIGTIKWFNKNHKSPIPDVETAGKTIEDTSTSTSKLTGKLQSLAKNLGYGILIMAEVAVAAGIFVGSIWGIGVMLEQVGLAWQPVLDNGATVVTAIGYGTSILAGVGIVVGVLGTMGGAFVGQLALGIAMLALLGVSAGLFLAEIWGIGVLLEQIGIAWQPVLDNGDTIKIGIKTGTALLVAIGVVTAALGAATVASAGALPVAIAIGTGLLLELGKAFKEFCDSLIDVADKLRKDLHPSLEKLNKVLPKLNTNMEDFTEFMIDFAEMTVEYTKSTAISGFASTIDSIIGFFTKDPIQALADDVEKQYKQSKELNKNLALANPNLQTAITGLRTYKSRIDTLKGVVDKIDVSEIATSGFTNLVTIGGKIADFGGKMKSYYEKIKDITVTKMDNMVSCMNDIIDFAVRIKNEVEITKINDFTEAIKKLTTAVKNLPTSKSLTIKLKYETIGSAPNQFASGGFPETGEMFIAREAGPELVGSIGRKTAVANNDQIVAGIASGVASANTESNALLREQNSLLKALLEKESGVYLDGKRLTNSVEKYQSQRGRQIVVGGAY